MALVLENASGQELREEQQRLLAQAVEMLKQGAALQAQATRLRTDSQIDHDRSMDTHVALIEHHDLLMTLHADFMRVSNELRQRRVV